VLLYRERWAFEPDDPPWVSMKSGHGADTAPLRMLQNSGKPRKNGAEAADDSAAPQMQKPQPAPNGHAQQRVVVLL
jgi:hypothetical protein